MLRHASLMLAIPQRIIVGGPQDARRRQADRANAAEVLAREEAARAAHLAQQEASVREAEEELRAKYDALTAKMLLQQVNNTKATDSPHVHILLRLLQWLKRDTQHNFLPYHSFTASSSPGVTFSTCSLTSRSHLAFARCCSG